MSRAALGELGFENRVEDELLRRGWVRGQRTYSAELGLDTGELVRFVGATQGKNWAKLIQLYGGNSTTAQKQFALRVAGEIDARGVLDVLRQGVKDRGVQIALAYFRPGLLLTANALKEYNENVLTVERQLHFSARNATQSVDMAFFVNGLPVASVELKNPNTGQQAEDAIAQYRGRDPNELFFAKRTLVHFAVDPDRAFITTRLKGQDTQFLPFNVGSAGPGNSGGAGNPTPVRATDYPVSYLWDAIWQRDNWLEILQRFLHVEATDRRAGKVNPHTSPRIFPRFHQWHAVQAMVGHAREHGAGQRYLVQHSAGSGKSNTIAWLAHRLSNLFGDDKQLMFHKVIVITDRVVLDRQLQRTIFQFDHTPGVVKKIDTDAAQLADALTDSTSRIIISTLQMYPYMLDKVAEARLGVYRYAVIIDEAHSSQGGDAAARLKQALGANAVTPGEDEDLATYHARARGPQPNLSYFAFTATPKFSTLQLFGTFDPDRVNPRTGEHGMYAPFHTYSMQQAIEEGFILDVLANYFTYDAKWKLSNTPLEHRDSSLGNPEVDERRARAKLVTFAERHPTSLKQKAKLIIGDFHAEMSARLGGRAKAMVVTTGRQHAFDLYQALSEWDRMLPECGFGVLVAFSGSLKDVHTELEFTEGGLNGFPEGQLPDKFGYVRTDDPDAAKRPRDEYRILVVADKYQTGFDQPLLCGMYVDKPLTGVAAVQTLSRLNRTHPLKSQDDVRILDFANHAEDIQAAFEPWYRTTITEPTDPNLLYDRERKVTEYGLLEATEMESFFRVLAEAGPGRLAPAAEKELHAQLHLYLKPAVDRFVALDSDDEREEFRKALLDFTRLYSLVAQVMEWSDRELERLFQYGRILLIRLPGRPPVSVDIGDADLSHYRLEFTGQHNLSLAESGGGDGVVRGHSSGASGSAEPELRPLADIIEELNERFGLGLSTSDRILVMQQVNSLAEDKAMQQVALSNDEARFGQVADDRLDDIVAENAERNTEFMKLYFDNLEFQKAIKEAARRRAYQIILDPARDEALARLRAEMARETGLGGF
jgi:type I restriction enzyme R subunit